MSPRAASLLLVTALGSIAAAQAPPAHDAAAAFLREGAPSRAWSYGAEEDGAFTPHTRFTRREDGFEYWHADDPASGCVGRAPGPAPLVADGYTLPTTALFLHPGAHGEAAVVRWTAPAAGTWRIRARFEGVSPVRPTVGVRVRGPSGPLFVESLNLRRKGNVATFEGQRALEAGQTIDVVVDDAGNGFGSDGTAVTFTLDLVG